MLRVIQHNHARSYVWTMAVLKPWVEQKADVVWLQKPPRESEGIRISHLAYQIGKRNRVWTVVCKWSGRTMNECTDLSKNAGDNAIVVDIK